jgi:dihydroorotase
MLEAFHENKISLEKIVEKMCHNPAILFQIKNRGFIRTGYHADLVIFNLNKPWTVNKKNILYKCGWSPFEGKSFKSRISHTIINGEVIYDNFKISNKKNAKRLNFDR